VRLRGKIRSFKRFFRRRRMNVLVPGVGELVWGSQREERLEVLEDR
jgi:aspartyl/asparaginyl-tRNA synthetase